MDNEKYSKIHIDFARNSIRYIIKAFNISEIYIPFYTCPTVWQAIQKETCKIHFYHIDFNFMPTIEFPKNSFILYTNYFGICAENVKELSKKYINLIIDNAHAFYMPPFGIASFNSPRKFFNELNCGSELFSIKTTFNNFPIKLNYDNLLQNINIEEAKTKRLENFKFFHSILKSKNMLSFNLSLDDVPMFYPFLQENNQKLNKILIENKYKIDTYWSAMPLNSTEGFLQKFLTPIPINNYLSPIELGNLSKIINRFL